MPLVTVLMSVFNGAKYLEAAIASITTQTLRAFEFIIVDDASTDDTPAILRRCRDPRLVLLRNEENRGLTWSLNLGLRRARGEFIARMDADDLSEADRLEEQAAYLRVHPDVGLVCSAATIVDEQGVPVGTHTPSFSPEHFYFFLNYKNCIVHSSVLFRREIVERLGGYDERRPFAQDFELWQRLARTARIAQLDRRMVRWRRHKGGISASWKCGQDRAVHGLVSSRLYRLTGQEITPDELAHLQQECPQDEGELERELTILSGIRQGLFSQEKEIMRTLRLKERAIARIARETQGRLLSRHFHRLPRKQWPGFLWHIGTRHPLLLGGKVVAAAAHRMKGLRLAA